VTAWQSIVKHGSVLMSNDKEVLSIALLIVIKCRRCFDDQRSEYYGTLNRVYSMM
jgi:hypothetical protein